MKQIAGKITTMIYKNWLSNQQIKKQSNKQTDKQTDRLILFCLTDDTPTCQGQTQTNWFFASKWQI
jgi:hypothetical protein